MVDKTKRYESQRKYDLAHTRMFSLKFNTEHDKDIVDVLENSPNKQIIIKRALRFYIKNGMPVEEE